MSEGADLFGEAHIRRYREASEIREYPMVVAHAVARDTDYSLALAARYS